METRVVLKKIILFSALILLIFFLCLILCIMTAPRQIEIEHEFYEYKEYFNQAVKYVENQNVEDIYIEDFNENYPNESIRTIFEKLKYRGINKVDDTIYFVKNSTMGY